MSNEGSEIKIKFFPFSNQATYVKKKVSSRHWEKINLQILKSGDICQEKVVWGSVITIKFFELSKPGDICQKEELRQWEEK